MSIMMSSILRCPVRLIRPQMLAMRLPDYPSRHQERFFQTSQPKQVFELVTFASVGYAFQTFWPSFPIWAKGIAACCPVMTAGMMTIYYARRTKFDDLLQRKKFMSSNVPRVTIPKETKFLEGEGVVKANNLLLSILNDNAKEIPGIYDPRLKWKVLVFKDNVRWYFFMENGMIFMAKDILTRLTQKELTAFLSIQAAHVLAKHHTEYLSHCQLVNYSLSLAGGLYAFFGPIIHSFFVEIGTLSASYFIISWFICQPKYLSILKEADKLGLIMASKQGVTHQDFISLFQKLKESRKNLPFFSRSKGRSYFEKRAKAIQSITFPEPAAS